ncbi:ABC transporter permease [Piscibacillus salipiscarius]|uniref:ABC transporter permease n=1 Tax=Piscibacillus salipiscarius TaxID=299480 RepID=A0ABW5QBP7_9BACI
MIFHLWKYEWKRVFKRPVLFLFTIIFPIIVLGLTAAFIYSVSTEELETVEILVLDDDQTFETKSLIKQLQDDETIEGDVILSEGQKDLSFYLEHPESYAAIVQIPKGFTKQLRSGVNESIHVYLNEKLPLASNLAYLLLESGQDYISAAQTGVNTVNHFYVQNMEDAKERQQFLQQSIIHFTTFSLGRNSFFDEKSASDETLSWTEQIFVIICSLLILFTYWLQVVLFQPKQQSLIHERLKLVGVTRVTQLLAKWFFHITLLVVYTLGLIYLLYYVLFQGLQAELQLILYWVMIALTLTVILIMVQLFIPYFWLSVTLFTILSLAFLLIGGLLIPPAYIPQSLSQLTFIYDGLTTAWLRQTIATNHVIVFTLIMIIPQLLLLIFRKIGVILR